MQWVLHSRPARHLSAVHDAWRLTLVIRGRHASGGKFGENSPHLLGNIEEGKSKKKLFTAWIVMPRTIDVPRTPVAGSL